MRVLDASAVLALVRDEPGAEVVMEALPGSGMSTANLAEVVGKLVDLDFDPSALPDLLTAAGVAIEALSAGDAVLAGALRSVDGGQALSLGDRCCLALAMRGTPAVAVTADRAWADLDLPVEVRLVR